MNNETTIPKEKISKFGNIRKKYKGFSITPPDVHLVDISAVYHENIFNIIGYVFTLLGSIFVSLFYASSEKHIWFLEIFAWILLVFGIILYLYAKIYLFLHLRKGKIPLDEYIDEEDRML